ncbi:MAG: indole-3-glycerol phosphate synthase TrpC [Nanoarchaeota archaeon]|nr:indole-3-glycerol phosphate synthase TrpC [Nanoarchaeota archaeon]
MILDKIIKAKRKQVATKKKKLSLSRLKPHLKKSDRDFKKAISKGFNLIAEIKRGSPSEGIINTNFNLENIAKTYQKNRKVKAISVLTDRKFFFMGKSCLKTVRKLTKKPLLRKDFIIDEYQIHESRFYGANAILLIARLLTKEKIDKFISIAKKYDMDCLVEVHTLGELKKVLKTKADIIGINNRNLDTLKVDLNTTLELAKKIPKNKIIVTESGYYSSKELKKVKNKANAVLIGTSILKSKNINKKINELMK